MSLYTKEQISEVKSKVNYYDFYSKYIENIPNNKNRVFVNCPFHQEQKPSFQIDLTYGICVHCGEKSSEIDPTTGWCIDCIEEERFYQETMRGL